MTDYDNQDFGNQEIRMNTGPGEAVSNQSNNQAQGGDNMNPPQNENAHEPTLEEKITDKVADKAADEIQDSAAEKINKSCAEKYLCCLSFLRKYFNITSNDFYKRFIFSLVPFNKNFQPLIDKTPDLYGPFWIYTTLVIAIASAGSITKFIQGNSSKNFFQTFVPVAAAVIYGIGFGLPIILGIMMKCFGSEASIPSIICTYGYSYGIFIPVVILCVIPSEVAQWILLGYAAFSSTSLMAINYWKELGEFVDKKRYIIIAVVLVCQGVIFFLFKLYFFQRFHDEMSISEDEEGGENEDK